MKDYNKDSKAFFKQYLPDQTRRAYERGLITLWEAIQTAYKMTLEEANKENQ